MKPKFIINIIAKTLFLSCLLILAINFGTNIKFSFHYYFTFFWAIYLISLLLVILTSKHKFKFLITGIIPIVLSITYIFNGNYEIGYRHNILNSKYEIMTYRNEYQIISKYLFFEKVVAVKESFIFSNSTTKIGIINSSEIEVELLNELNNEITIAIKTTRNGESIDTLTKKKILLIN